MHLLHSLVALCCGDDCPDMPCLRYMGSALRISQACSTISRGFPGRPSGLVVVYVGLMLFPLLRGEGATIYVGLPDELCNLEPVTRIARRPLKSTDEMCSILIASKDNEKAFV